MNPIVQPSTHRGIVITIKSHKNGGKRGIDLVENGLKIRTINYSSFKLFYLKKRVLDVRQSRRMVHDGGL